MSLTAAESHEVTQLEPAHRKIYVLPSKHFTKGNNVVFQQRNSFVITSWKRFKKSIFCKL